jgi:hypothetical protein
MTPAQTIVAKILAKSTTFAYEVTKILCQQRFAGPWAPYPDFNLIGRPAPDDQGTTARLLAQVSRRGLQNYEWRTLATNPGGGLASNGVETSLIRAVKAADHALKDAHFKTVGLPRIGSPWSKAATDAISNQIIPCTVYRNDEATNEALASVQYGFLDLPGAPEGPEGDHLRDVEGAYPRAPGLQAGLVERRPGEPIPNLLQRAQNLVDGHLRSHQGGEWILDL